MVMERSKSEDKQLDFSQPWKFSDAVLVVEEERVHVHRAVLSISSPVFEKMFTSEFREKDYIEVSLPGKSSTEVKELLLMIYPSASDKQITEETCHFLVKLAHEYQMDAIVKRCEDFLVDKLKTKPKSTIVSELVFAQIYKLEKLRKASVEEGCNLRLEQLKENDMYDQIESENLKEIMEGVITLLQKELEESLAQNQQKEKKINAAKARMPLSGFRDPVLSLTGFLFQHISPKHNHPTICTSYGFRTKVVTESYLIALEMDKGTYHCKCGSVSKCYGLSSVASYLRSLKRTIEFLRD